MAWAHDQKVPDAESKLLLLVLANYTNHINEAWPSISTLAEECMLSERTIQYRLAELEKSKIITITKRKTGIGDSDTNFYVLNAPVRGGAPHAPGGCTPCTTGGAPHAPNPISRNQEREKEPPIELPTNFPKTAKDAITACSNAGIPPVFIEQDWGECFARGGKDRQGHAIYNYVVHAKVAYSRHKSWQEEHKLLQPNGHNGATRVKTMDEATVYDCL